MARTKQEAVKEVLGTDYDTNRNPSLRPFIDTANVIVNRVQAQAAVWNITLTDQELELIERWLAAHNYALSDQPYTARTTERASGQFQGRTDMGLDATKYGQEAKRIDWSGALTAIDKRQFARAQWLGKPASAQIPIWQRN